MESPVENLQWKLDVAVNERDALQSRKDALNIPMGSLCFDQYQELLLLKGQLTEAEEWIQQLEKRLTEVKEWEATPVSRKLWVIFLPILLVAGWVAGLIELAHIPYVGGFYAVGYFALTAIAIVSFAPYIREKLGTELPDNL
jgi:hypothetical protein